MEVDVEVEVEVEIEVETVRDVYIAINRYREQQRVTARDADSQ